MQGLQSARRASELSIRAEPLPQIPLCTVLFFELYKQSAILGTTVNPLAGTQLPRRVLLSFDDVRRCLPVH
jgi:hypothetical protein